MAQPLHPFQSVDEAVNRLRQYQSNFQIPVSNKSKNEIAGKLIYGNIARAFPGIRPVDLTGRWGLETVESLLNDLHSTKSQNDFDVLIHRYANSLINFWDNAIQAPSKRIGWGPASKITNLFVKALYESEHIRNAEIFQFMHVPFDQYTIQPLRNIINALTLVRYGINIPVIPTMKFVNTPMLYDILQGAVRKLCIDAETLPIVYEYLCWDEQH